MICVSIAQTSRTFAKVDILNAGPLCDLIELRLDKFEEPPKIKELLEISKKPKIISCRRVQDGGSWEGSESDRLAMLRQAVLDKAAYVELELDVADQVRRYGETKRLISYTSFDEVPDDLDDIYQQCCAKDPDAIKITVPARTPEETWPIIKMIAKGSVPTVAVGIGKNGRMLSLLGRRYKSPWMYAALEKGMEAYPGSPTISELEDVFDYKAIDSKTPLVAVSGSMQAQAVFSKVLNTGLKAAESKMRCLPLEIGDIDLFRRIAKATKLEGLVLDSSHQSDAAKACDEVEERVKVSGAADFVSIHNEKWQGFNTLSRAIQSGLEELMSKKYPGEEPIAKRIFLVIGTSGMARAIAANLKRKGASVNLADADNKKSQALCNELGIRYMPAGQVYSTIPDVMIVTPDPKHPGKGAIDLPKSVAREGITMCDLSNFPYVTDLAAETIALHGMALKPSEIILHMATNVIKKFTGKMVPLSVYEDVFDSFDLDQSERSS